MRVTLATGTPAELVRPDLTPGEQPARGLVLLPDIGGLRPLMDHHVRTLSEATGWPVCAPEPWPGREHVSVPERLGLVGTLDDAAVLADAVAAADATGAAEVAVLGFCMGGMYALKASSTGRFVRAVAFYGMIRVPEAWSGPGQGQPLDAVAARGDTEVMEIVGTIDQWTPPEDVDALEALGATVVRYEGADHGFVHDPDRPVHRPEDAADAWSRVLAFLAG